MQRMNTCNIRMEQPRGRNHDLFQVLLLDFCRLSFELLLLIFSAAIEFLSSFVCACRSSWLFKSASSSDVCLIRSCSENMCVFFSSSLQPTPAPLPLFYIRLPKRLLQLGHRFGSTCKWPLRMHSRIPDVRGARFRLEPSELRPVAKTGYVNGGRGRVKNTDIAVLRNRWF